MSQGCTGNHRKTPTKDQKSGKPSGAWSWHSSLFSHLSEVSKSVVTKHAEIIVKQKNFQWLVST